jgi:hypothetical protein
MVTLVKIVVEVTSAVLLASAVAAAVFLLSPAVLQEARSLVPALARVQWLEPDPGVVASRMYLIVSALVATILLRHAMLSGLRGAAVVSSRVVHGRGGYRKGSVAAEPVRGARDVAHGQVVAQPSHALMTTGPIIAKASSSAPYSEGTDDSDLGLDPPPRLL